MMKFLTMAVAALAVASASPAVMAEDVASSLTPVLSAREGWLNASVDAASVRGKVVIVDVFTFGCINCQNVIPNLRALRQKHPNDLLVVGVHSPETPYERSRANVASNLKSLDVAWPVAIDNSFAIWHAYHVEAWPTQLLFDRHGRLRKTIVGDSQDDEVDATIERLLAEQ